MGGHAALVPPEVAASFPTKRPAVVATVNGTEYRSRLMVYGGKTYLGLRKDLLRKIGAGAGDTVQIELTEDHQERIVTEPPELSKHLRPTRRHARRTTRWPTHTGWSMPAGSEKASSRKLEPAVPRGPSVGYSEPDQIPLSATRRTGISPSDPAARSPRPPPWPDESSTDLAPRCAPASQRSLPGSEAESARMPADR